VRPHIFIVFILILLCKIGGAQSYFYKHYGLDEGLSQSQVLSLYQDEIGQMWIGTNGGGVNIFDGKVFAVLSTDNGLPSDIIYGIETGNEDLLLRIKKGATMEQARRAAYWTREFGIDMRGSFVLALPGETPVKAQKTIKFAIEIDPTFVQFLPAFPEWGTEFYDDAIKNGRLASIYQGRTTATYIPQGYKDADEVRKIQKEAYASFYFRPSFIWKHLKRLRSLNIIKQYYQGLRYILGVSQ